MANEGAEDAAQARGLSVMRDTNGGSSSTRLLASSNNRQLRVPCGEITDRVVYEHDRLPDALLAVGQPGAVDLDGLEVAGECQISHRMFAIQPPSPPR